MRFNIKGHVNVEAFSFKRPVRVAYLLAVTGVGVYVYGLGFLAFAMLFTSDLKNEGTKQ